MTRVTHQPSATTRRRSRKRRPMVLAALLPASLLLMVAGADLGAAGAPAEPTSYTATVWGSQDDVPAGARDGVIGISAGHVHSLAARADGTVVAWGNGGQGQTDVPPGLSHVTQVAGGWVHSLALKDDGTVVAWATTATPTSPTGWPT